MSTTGSPAPASRAAKRGEVSYKFCGECANLLYPKENRSSSTLEYVCKACHHVEQAEPSCTFRRELGSSVTETAGVTTDVANDPTLPRAHKKCPRCAGQDAVYFQSQQRADTTGMKLYYVCLDCGHTYTTV